MISCPLSSGWLACPEMTIGMAAPMKMMGSLWPSAALKVLRHSTPRRASFSCSRRNTLSRRINPCTASASEPLDLTQENVQRVLLDARSELLQLFDTSVGITGVAELADLDGPFLKLRLQGRFWHQRSVVLARLANYLQKRIPEIVEVEIEDESQLDDSAANFGHS